MAFEAGAALYDALANRPGRLEREGALLGRLLQEAPATRVLDIACGTGLHAHYLATLGAAVVAVDLSSGMIRYARERRPHPRITYREGDMRSLTETGHGLVICLGNSMALIANQSDLRSVFRGVRQCLLPGGCFLVQLVNGDAPGCHAVRHRLERVTLPGVLNGDGIVLKTLAPYEGQTLLSLAYFTFSGLETDSHAESAVLTHWSVDALRAAAASEDLTLTAAWGSFHGEPFAAAESPDLIALFKQRAHTE